MKLSVRLVSARVITDTIGVELASPLVAEVFGDDGRTRPAITVRFEVVDSVAGTAVGFGLRPSQTSPASRLVEATTGANGRASVYAMLGDRIGDYRVKVSAVGSTVEDTAAITVSPGAAREIRIPVRDTLVSVGKTVASGITLLDRLQHVLTTAPTLAATSTSCRIEDAQITGVSIGRCAISVRAGSALDSLYLTVVPSASLVAIRIDQGAQGGWRLSSLNFDGSNRQDLAVLQSQSFSNPQLPTRAPDGIRLTMHSGMGGFSTHITVFDSAGLPRTFVPAGVSSLHENWARFSRDGKWLYFSVQRPGEAFTVWRAHADGTGAEQITTAGSWFGFKSNYMDITPDGNRIVYVDERLYLRTMDLTSRVSRGLEGGGGPLQSFALRLSPDGRRVAYVYEPPDRFGLRLVNVDGTGYRTLSTAVGYDDDNTTIDWTPDGEWVLVRRWNVGPSFLSAGDWVLVNATSGEIVPLPYKDRFNVLGVVR